MKNGAKNIIVSILFFILIQILFFTMVRYYINSSFELVDNSIKIEANDNAYISEDKYCKIYFYDVEKNEKIYEERKIKGGENFSRRLLENLLIPPANRAILIPENGMDINDVFIEGDVVILDFKSNFVNKNGFTKELEQVYINNIVNTFCVAFSVNKAKILKNGEIYSNIHGFYDENEYIYPTLDKYKEIVE